MTNWRAIERDGRDQLGEGPLWSADSGMLHWVDIVGCRLWSMRLADERTQVRAMPEKICWVAERRNGAGLVAGFKSGIGLVELDPFGIEMKLAPEADRPGNRLNDAKVDALGRIWFGSKHDADMDASGAFYRLDADFTAHRFDDGYMVANGPSFSPDGSLLYHTDSGRRCIYRFALRDDATLGPREVFISFEPEWGYPDGMTTDAEGCLWVAHWGGARVSRFDPDGRMMHSVSLPATNITSCTFAGEGLDRMFVTSSAEGLEHEPMAGALFEIDPGVKGLPTAKFAG